MQVPAFLLRRLYVKGSLHNTDDGFEFELMNTLGAGYADRVLPLQVDGQELPLEQAAFVVDRKRIRFDEISPEQPMTLAMNNALSVSVKGRPLADGKHTLGIGFEVSGMGELQFDVTDAIGEDDGDAGQ